MNGTQVGSIRPWVIRRRAVVRQRKLVGDQKRLSLDSDSYSLTLAGVASQCASGIRQEMRSSQAVYA